jgi:TatD DNase family protein
MPTPLIDIAANLTHESFAEDVDEVIERALHAGVPQLLIAGTSGPGSQAAAELAGRYPGRLLATAGLHPHHADEYNAEMALQFAELLKLQQVVAVGETGLDYFRDLSPRPKQIHAFEAHIEMAINSGLPMYLHQRDAHSDFLPILRTCRDQLSGVVVHCFTDSRDALHAYLDLDCYIGITGWLCDERRGQDLQQMVADVPDQRLLVETDAPYLKPRNLRPKVRTHRNEPQWLPWVVQELARHRGQSAAHIGDCSTANARRLFGFADG